jgi:hypothetical protein
METKLTGPYELRDIGYLRRKANADDPRAPFYRALIMCPTYEAYLALIGGMWVILTTEFKKGPISGRIEILYCRRNGKIKDKVNERLHDCKTLSPALPRDLSA